MKVLCQCCALLHETDDGAVSSLCVGGTPHHFVRLEAPDLPSQNSRVDSTAYRADAGYLAAVNKARGATSSFSKTDHSYVRLRGPFKDHEWHTECSWKTQNLCKAKMIVSRVNGQWEATLKGAHTHVAFSTVVRHDFGGASQHGQDIVTAARFSVSPSVYVANLQSTEVSCLRT